MPERLDITEDGIGKAALFAHLLHQTRRKTTAADQLVQHERSHEIRILSGHRTKAEHGNGLRNIHFDEFLEPPHRRFGLINGREFGVSRKPAEHGINELAELLLCDIANGHDLEIRARKHPSPVVFKVIPRNGGDTGFRTL